MIESNEPYVLFSEREQAKKKKKSSSKNYVADTQTAADDKNIASAAVDSMQEINGEEAPAAINVPDVRTVVCNWLLNVRKKPNGEVVKTIPNGTKVEVVEELDKWCKLIDGNYVMTEFLKK